MLIPTEPKQIVMLTILLGTFVIGCGWLAYKLYKMDHYENGDDDSGYH